MVGPGEYYAKGNKPARERLVPHDFIYMWNLMNKINKQNRNILIDIENRPITVRREGSWGTG